MTDFEESAELREEHGFDRAGEFLRGVGAGTTSVFLVWQTVFEARLPVELRGLRSFHLDRAAAQAVAIRQNIAGLRTIRTSGPYFDQAHERFTRLSYSDFMAQARAILGPTYWLPRGGNMPLFPPAATDGQLRALLPLLRFRYYEVIESPFVG